MRRALGVLLITLVVAACGDSGTPAGPGGGNVTTALPPLSAVWFGTAFDPATLALTDKGSSFKTGTPIVAVGTLVSPRTPDQVKVRIETSGSIKAELPVAPGAVGSTFAVDLTTAGLGPGPYLISFIDNNRKNLASASFNVTP
jgi:hypothetical protein